MFHNKIQNIITFSPINLTVYRVLMMQPKLTILNLRGISSSEDCGEFIRALKELVNNQVIVKKLVEGVGKCPQLSFAYERKLTVCHPCYIIYYISNQYLSLFK